MALNSGDTVQLKSGGPVMTIQKLMVGTTYRCQWFAGKKLEVGDFPEDSLIQASPPPAAPALKTP